MEVVNKDKYDMRVISWIEDHKIISEFCEQCLNRVCQNSDYIMYEPWYIGEMYYRTAKIIEEIKGLKECLEKDIDMMSDNEDICFLNENAYILTKEIKKNPDNQDLKVLFCESYCPFGIHGCNPDNCPIGE